MNFFKNKKLLLNSSIIFFILLFNSLLLQFKVNKYLYKLKLKEKYYDTIISSEQETNQTKEDVDSLKNDKIDKLSLDNINQLQNNLNNRLDKANEVLQIGNSAISFKDKETERDNLINQKNIRTNLKNQYDINLVSSNYNLQSRKNDILNYEKFTNLFELNNLNKNKKFHLLDTTHNNYLITNNINNNYEMIQTNNIMNYSNKDLLTFQLDKINNNNEFYTYNDTYVLKILNNKLLYVNNFGNLHFTNSPKNNNSYTPVNINLIPIKNVNNRNIRNGEKFKVVLKQKNENGDLNKKFLVFNNNTKKYMFTNNLKNHNPSVLKFEYILN